VATAALLVGLTSCSEDQSSTSSADPTPSSSQSGPSPTDAEAVDHGLSEPVEDSVYPAVGDPSVDALNYELDLTWDPERRVLTGDEGLQFRSTGTADHIQLDLARHLEVSSLQVDGLDADFDHEGKDLVVFGDFVADQQYDLSLSYSGTPAPVQAPTTRSDFDTTGFTVSDDGSAWTMQEPYGAYSWYAVNDQPADKAFYSFILTAPQPMTGVANGEMVGHDVEDGNTVTLWNLDSPVSSYLVTVAFGDYKVTEDESASGVPLSYWAPAGTPQRSVDSLRYTKDALAWVEDKLGPYPFSSLGVLLVDSRSGMETQTMITLGNTDYTTSRAVLVHEIVHQWYGDQVTPSDWSDLWMNEGMAMYLQLVWQAEDTGEPLHQILERVAPFERRSRRLNGPPAAYDPDTFGEIQVYYGPALMWDQVRRRVGDEAFWEMVRAWPSHDPDGSSNRDEYLAWVEEQTGTELSDLFRGWLLAKRSPAFE
jgi:aminopeptidase N